MSEGWSVRQIESYTGLKTRRRRAASAKKQKDADVKAVEQNLGEKLGTKVRINGTPARGKIEIDYYSREELDRLIELLGEL